MGTRRRRSQWCRRPRRGPRVCHSYSVWMRKICDWTLRRRLTQPWSGRPRRQRRRGCRGWTCQCSVDRRGLAGAAPAPRPPHSSRLLVLRRHLIHRRHRRLYGQTVARVDRVLLASSQRVVAHVTRHRVAGTKSASSRQRPPVLPSCTASTSPGVQLPLDQLDDQRTQQRCRRCHRPRPSSTQPRRPRLGLASPPSRRPGNR